MSRPLQEETQHEKQEEQDHPDRIDLSPSSDEAPMTFPEGGWTAWQTVIGGAMILFSTHGAIQSFGVFQDYYTRISLSDRTPSEVSWIGSFQTFLIFAMGLFTGRMFDEGYFHHLMIAGTLIYLFSFFMVSLTQPHHYYQTFLAQGVGEGIGMGLLFVPAVSVTSHYFRARRSLAMGVNLAGASIGGVIFPIMLNHLFIGKAGFAWGVRAAAFLILGLLITANAIMRTRLPSRRNRPKENKPDLKKIMRDGPYWICIAGSCLVFWGIWFPFFYLQLFAVSHGVDENIAFYAITILNASSLFGRTLPNLLADRVGPFNVLIPMSFISGILIFALFGAGNLGGMIVVAILYGFFSGGFISLISPTLAAFATDLNDVGSRIGIAMFIMSFFLLTGTPITGALLQTPHYTWFRPILFSGVVIIAGTALLLVSREMVVRRRGTWRV